MSTNMIRILFFKIFQKAFDKYHSSIEIDIEQLVAYAHKNGLDDPFFRRLELIVYLSNHTL